MNGIKKGIKLALGYCYAASGYYRKIHKGKVAILMYHRVVNREDLRNSLIQPGMYVTRDTFQNHISYLMENYQIISFADLLENMQSNLFASSDQYCIITFDDGWRDNYLNAYPILKENNIPATIFIVPSFVNKTVEFWVEKLGLLFSKIMTHGLRVEKEQLNQILKEYGFSLEIQNHVHSFLSGAAQNNLSQQKTFHSLIESMKEYGEDTINSFAKSLAEYLGLDAVPSASSSFLTWEEIREMSEGKVFFGSHGMMHKILTRCSIADVDRELRDSHALLVGKDINYVPVFSYPNGNFNDLIAQRVAEAGYRAAVTTKFGVNKLGNLSHYQLSRLSIHEDIAQRRNMFALHISRLLSFASRV